MARCGSATNFSNQTSGTATGVFDSCDSREKRPVSNTSAICSPTTCPFQPLRSFKTGDVCTLLGSRPLVLVMGSHVSRSRMSEPRGSRAQVISYVLLVFAFSSIFYFLILRTHTLGAGGGLYVVGIMWCPALAAMATLRFNRRPLHELGWKWPSARYAAMSWYVPLLYATIAYIFVWGSGLG